MMERIGRYRITGKIGEGGMGVVYSARDEQLDRPVAVKVIRETAGPSSRERFRREARAAASVNHPNVCQLYEIGDDNGELYLAMELLEGESLATRLARGFLPVTEAVPIGLSVLAALGVLHQRGIVHRDLKPSNIKVRGDGTVKVLDFGLAKALDRDGDGAPGTATSPTISMHAIAAGIILGTAA
jgi:serine/threonine protein kinase